MEKVYIVTLKNRDDLEDFYAEMSSKGFKLHMKRKISRNTNYYMTQDQANELKKDSRVLDVELADNIIAKPTAIYNNTSYNKNGFFWKTGSFPIPTDFQWGHIHAGSASQIGKGSFGYGGTSRKNASVDVFNNGKHVDVVILDQPMAYDSEEWYSPSTNTSRFVQYQWFNELNSIVTSIDDDGITPQTGTINYPQNASLSSYHGQHVGGTVAGQYWGWAREANIYNFAVTDPWPSPQSGYTSNYLIYDYLRAFHLNKAVNPTTGRRNPTITNHSYSFIFYLNSGSDYLDFTKLSSVVYQGTTYNSSNPGSSGWTQSGVEADFGVRFNETSYPNFNSAIAADIQDAIDDGVVIVAAAGNENLLIAEENDVNYNNYIYYEYDTGDMRSSYYNRGGTVQSPSIDSICVGALGNDHNFRRTITI